MSHGQLWRTESGSGPGSSLQHATTSTDPDEATHSAMVRAQDPASPSSQLRVESSSLRSSDFIFPPRDVRQSQATRELPPAAASSTPLPEPTSQQHRDGKLSGQSATTGEFLVDGQSSGHPIPQDHGNEQMASQSEITIPMNGIGTTDMMEVSELSENKGDSASSEPSGILQVHSTVDLQDSTDLVDLIQDIFERDAGVRDNGVLLLDIPRMATSDIELPPKNFRFEGTSQRATVPAKLRGKGIMVIKYHEAKQTESRPQFEPCQDHSAEELENFYDSVLYSEKPSASNPYFNMDLSEEFCRPEGSYELTCGSPMDKLSYLAGVNTPYGYYSRGISHFGAHIEDWTFGSFNVLFAGQTKLWIAVKPSSQGLLEEKIREEFRTASTCTQFVRHLGLNIAPSTLKRWGVEYFLIPQKPGQLVAVTGKTYHWGLNMGKNYAEAINFCLEKDWSSPDDYTNCYLGCGIGDIPLPKPFYEEGTLAEKIERCEARSTETRAKWVADMKAAEEAKEASKKRKSDVRPQTEVRRKSMEQTSPGSAAPVSHADSRDRSNIQHTSPQRAATATRPVPGPVAAAGSEPPSSLGQLPDPHHQPTTHLLTAVSSVPQGYSSRGRTLRPSDKRGQFRGTSSSPSEAESSDGEQSRQNLLERHRKHTRAPSDPTGGVGDVRKFLQGVLADNKAGYKQQHKDNCTIMRWFDSVQQTIHDTQERILSLEAKSLELQARQVYAMEKSLEQQAKQTSLLEKIARGQRETNHFMMLMNNRQENTSEASTNAARNGRALPMNTESLSLSRASSVLQSESHMLPYTQLGYANAFHGPMRQDAHQSGNPDGHGHIGPAFPPSLGFHNASTAYRHAVPTGEARPGHSSQHSHGGFQFPGQHAPDPSLHHASIHGARQQHPMHSLERRATDGASRASRSSRHTSVADSMLQSSVENSRASPMSNDATTVSHGDEEDSEITERPFGKGLANSRSSALSHSEHVHDTMIDGSATLSEMNGSRSAIRDRQSAIHPAAYVRSTAQPLAPAAEPVNTDTNTQQINRVHAPSPRTLVPKTLLNMEDHPTAGFHAFTNPAAGKSQQIRVDQSTDRQTEAAPLPCLNCRSRKRKCSKSQPACQMCEREGKECVYPTSSKSKRRLSGNTSATATPKKQKLASAARSNTDSVAGQVSGATSRAGTPRQRVSNKELVGLNDFNAPPDSSEVGVMNLGQRSRRRSGLAGVMSN